MECFLIFVNNPCLNNLAAQGAALQTMQSSTVVLSTTAYWWYRMFSVIRKLSTMPELPGKTCSQATPQTQIPNQPIWTNNSIQFPHMSKELCTGRQRCGCENRLREPAVSCTTYSQALTHESAILESRPHHLPCITARSCRCRADNCVKSAYCR